MRDDQYARLQMLHEKWVDILIHELDDPLIGSVDGDNGAIPIPADQLSTKKRGDRYWQKKNIAASLTLANKIQTTLERPVKGLPTLTADHVDRDQDKDDEVDAIEKEISRHESQAMKLLDEYYRTMQSQNIN